MAEQQNKTTDFGYETILEHEKATRVAEVFTSVADQYDLMNDLMSFGIHRLWKRMTMMKANVKPGERVLDVAGGSGDLTLSLAEKVGKNGRVVLADINQAMLHVGRDRLMNQGVVNNVAYVQANAECLPFTQHHFDCVTIAFGLRNVTDKQKALRSMFRLIKPGGRLLILEFSKPVLAPLQTLYDLYSFNVIPKLGQWVLGDADSYRYLVESIRRHPDQETLAAMVHEAGFEDCQYVNMTGGVVALHKAYKY